MTTKTEPTYAVERLTPLGTWVIWSTGWPYQEAANLCYNIVALFEMEVCRMHEEENPFYDL